MSPSRIVVCDNGDAIAVEDTQDGTTLSRWRSDGTTVEVAGSAIAGEVPVVCAGAGDAVIAAGDTLLVAAPDGTSRSIVTGAEPRLRDARLVVSADGASAAVAAAIEGGRAVFACDLRAGSTRRLDGPIGNPVAIAPDGAIAAGATDRGALLWRPGDAAPRRLADEVGRAFAIAFSADGARLAVAGDAGIAVVSRDGDGVTHRVGLHQPDRMIFTPDGSQLLTITPWTVDRWDVASGQRRSTYVPWLVDLHVAADGAATIAAEYAIVTLRDDLPREPTALAAFLAALP
jgi:hypothetical protein